MAEEIALSNESCSVCDSALWTKRKRKCRLDEDDRLTRGAELQLVVARCMTQALHMGNDWPDHV